MDANIGMGAYANLSDEALEVEFERVVDNQNEANLTVFSRMLCELHAHQIEIEMQQRKLAKVQHQLEESRGLSVSLNELTTLSYFSFDQDGVIREVSLAASNLVGIDQSALIGLSFIKLIAPQDRDRFLQLVRTHISANTPGSAEFVLDLPDGKSIEVQMTCIVSQFAGGKDKCCQAALTDITEHRQIERKLQLSEKILDSIGEGVMLADAQFKVVVVNPALLRMTGYRADELIGQTPAILKSDFHNDEFYQGIYDVLKKNDCWQGEIRIRRKSGEMQLRWLNISVIRNDGGGADNYICILSDINNQDEIQEMD